MTTKLRIKIGHIEFEYEGVASFDHEAIKDLFSHIESLAGAPPSNTVLREDRTLDPAEVAPLEGKLHPNTVATRLAVQSGADLALAAAATLQIVNGATSFTRKDLLETMKSATNYYKTTMSSNLSKALETLTTGKKFNQIGQNSYSLAAGELTSLRGRIAE